MKFAAVVAIAATSFATARVARGMAAEQRPREMTERPYAPSPGAAPIVALGYREVAADLLYTRMVGYFAAYDSAPDASAALAEAIVALDPTFRRAYELGATAMTDGRRAPELALQLRALSLLEKGMREFPSYWRFPNLAGQIYLVELKTDDPAQRRAWDERGALLLEAASRKPGAPTEAAVHAAVLQSRLGQQQRAIENLREILLITRDERAKKQLLERLAELTNESSDELAAELLTARKAFERAWQAERPAVTPSMYILIGPRPAPGFDLGDLATGGRDLIGTQIYERLEPLYDEPSDAQGVEPSDAPGVPNASE